MLLLKLLKLLKILLKILSKSKSLPNKALLKLLKMLKIITGEQDLDQKRSRPPEWRAERVEDPQPREKALSSSCKALASAWLSTIGGVKSHFLLKGSFVSQWPFLSSSTALLMVA